MNNAKDIIENLGLQPHPEGGYFKEIHRSSINTSGRSAGTGIYYLLEQGDFSAVHRVNSADETWHHYAGGDLELHSIDLEGNHSVTILSSDLDSGLPVHVIPAGHWQAARPCEDTNWTLCGCTVYPGFEFSDFEMPKRETLKKDFPFLESIIVELTKS